MGCALSLCPPPSFFKQGFKEPHVIKISFKHTHRHAYTNLRGFPLVSLFPRLSLVVFKLGLDFDRVHEEYVSYMQARQGWQRYSSTISSRSVLFFFSFFFLSFFLPFFLLFLPYLDLFFICPIAFPLVHCIQKQDLPLFVLFFAFHPHSL